ncbi:MAG: hypothetical protein LQ346_004798 [Caloplaca aetnensis]|nr:MAG: hypothetical protein LQ346_004798 [Caloplaca aetnensis]
MDVSNNPNEQEDFAVAIAASLATPGSNSACAPQRWIPQTAADWQIYRRQLGLEEQAHEDSSSPKTSDPLTGREELKRLPLRDFVSRLEPVKGSGSLNQPPSKDFIPLTESPKGRLWASRQKAPISLGKVGFSGEQSGNGNGQPEKSDPQTPEPVRPTSEGISPPRHTIEDCIKEMAHGHSDELPRIDDHDGDTWVFIDPAAQQPEQTDREYEAYSNRYAKPIVIKSATLKQLQSSFFEERLNSSYQFRVTRRRRLRQSLPPDIKYVIDLTPPTEGDEAAWLMSELCCVDGVRNWSQSHSRWQISNTLVGGREEFSGNRSNDVPAEVCPIRHRACIERVLNGIRGFDPKLDSAVKVYTTFVVARFFGITQSSLTDYIVRWIRAPPNSLFIEALPEIALKIGDGLQCLELVRDSFAILVGEEALEMPRKRPDAGYTIYGRKKNDLPESYKTRIEYASKSFLERVLKAFEDLTEYDMRWMENLSAFKQLPSELDEMLDETLGPVVNEFKIALKAYVRGVILTVLHSELLWAPNLQMGLEGGESLYPRISRQGFSDSLDVKKRILTSTFWQALQECRFYRSTNSLVGASNLNVWPENPSGWRARISQKDLTALVREHGVKEVPYRHLEALSERCRKGVVVAEKVSTVRLENQRQDPWDPQLPLLQEPQSFDDMMWDSTVNCPGPQFSQRNTKSTVTGSGTSDVELAAAYRKSLKDPGFKLLHLPAFDLQIEQFLQSFAQNLLCQQDTERLEHMEMNMTPVLVGLDQAEWKYLPLYAGGLDDGSGGVFNDDVPSAQIGFSTAGPGVHTGSGSSAASSEFDFVGRKDLESTHHTSTVVNDGFSDQLDRRVVYDEGDELWDEVLKGKNTTGSIAASYTESGTMAAPSIIGPDSETDTMGAPSTTNGESEDDFVLPLRYKDQDPAPGAPIGHNQASADQDGKRMAADDLDDSDAIFMDSDDDTATEKGDDDDYEMCEDEDMVMV